ncbi:RHS repeat-associated core domain-containing protein [Streptomyces tsukubensis]
MAVNTVGNFSEIRFEADQGQEISFGFTQSTFNGQISARLIDPQGTQIRSAFLLGVQSTGEWGYSNLPVSGQYALTLAPLGNKTGAVTVTVSTPVTVDLSPTAPPTGLTIDRPGQDGVAAFTADAGKRVSLGVTTSGFASHNTLTVRRPNGATLTTLTVPNNAPFDWDSSSLPETGTYRISVAPNGINTGTLILTLSEPAQSGLLTLSATPAQISMVRTGQNAESTFQATAGSDLSIGITGNTFTSTVYASVISPSGNAVVNEQYIWAGDRASIGLNDLPETGTYRVVLDPHQGATGSLEVSLSDDVRTAVTADGTSVTASIPRPGQRLRASFVAPQSASLGFAVTSNNVTAATEVYLQPGSGSGTRVATISSGTDGVAHLPGLTPGTEYTLLLSPIEAATGSLTMWLSTPIHAGTLSDTNPSGSGQISRPGQELQFSINAAAGDGAAVRFTNSTVSGNVSLVTPGGSLMPQVAWLSTGTGEVDLRAPLSSGNWTVLVQPNQTAVGGLSGTLVPDVTGPLLVVNDPPQQVAVSTAAQNARFIFNGIQGQQLTLATDPTSFGRYVSVHSPGGTWLVDNRYLSPTTLSTSLGTLPATGLYTVTVDPDAQAVGPVGLRVKTTGTARTMSAVKDRASVPAARAASPKSTTPTGPDTWRPDKDNLRGVDWITRGTAISAAPPRGLRPPPGVTAVTGRVLRLDGAGLARATVSIGKQSTRTDAKGRFLLAGISPSATTLVVDGTSANTPKRTWGRFEILFSPVSGKAVDLGFPVWMTPLDTRHTLRFDAPASNDLVLKTPQIPGLEVRIPRGSVVRDANGKTVTELGITAIPLDRPPFPLPEAGVVPVYFTVQPGGSYVFPKGAQIIYPNYTREAPGTRVEFMDYDPKKKGWHVYGYGKVSADGRQVVPDARTRVWTFHGAMFNTTSILPWDLSWLKDIVNWLSGDPVELSTGRLTDSRTDLAVTDTRGSVEVTRTYWQGDTRKRAFGVGRDLTYNAFLNSKNSWQEVDLYIPGGIKVHYTRTSPGTSYRDAVFEPTGTPSEFRGSRISHTNNGWELRFRDGTVWTFPQYSPLKRIRDRYGNTTSIVRRDGDRGDAIRVVSPGGRWISLGYDTSNRVTSATDNTGRTTSYSYDAAGRLTRVTDPTGAQNTYSYDGTSNRVKTATDARGITYMTNSFDADGRVREQVLTEGAKYTFTYTQTGAGQVTSTTVTEPDSTVRRVEFDASGYAVKDTRAHGTSMARTMLYTRGASHRIDTATDPYGRRTSFAYDTQGRVVGATELAGTAQARTMGTAVYNGPFDQPTVLTDALGNTTTLAYRADGALEKVTDAEGRITTLQNNTQGQIRTVTDASGAITEYVYANGELVTIRDSENRSSSQFTDAAGRPSSFTDEAGAVTSLRFDELNRIRVATDPLGGQTTFGYDANGNLTTLTDARNNSTVWSYDQADRASSVTDPLNAQASFEYDASNRITKATSRSGKTVTTTYDLLGRPATTQYRLAGTGTPQSTVTYGYGTADLLQSITDTGAGSQAFAYDSYDRLSSVTSPAGAVGYTYDLDDRRTQMTAAGTTTSYTYDRSDILTSVASGSDNVLFGLDSVGRERTAALPGGITRTTTYDSSGLTSGISYARGTAPIGDLLYSRDVRGLQTGLGGNLASVSLPLEETGAAFGRDNRITAFNGRSFAYDADGRLQSDGRRTYSWNARGELSGLSEAGGQVSSFTYDPLGIRSGRTLNGATRQFLTDGSNPLAELTSAGTPSATVSMSGMDEFLTRSQNGHTQVYLTDVLGTVHGLADLDGTVTTRYSYDPYGRPTASGTSSTNPYTFTGRENDQTGLLYYRSRYYDPETGRFISQDPIGHAGGINLYQYALSSPTTHSDPSGNSPLLVGCVVGGVIDGALDWGIQRLSGRKVNWGQVGRATAMGCAFGMVGARLGSAANHGSDLAYQGTAKGNIWVSDISHVTGKTARARNRAISAIIREDFTSLRFTNTPQYSPWVNTGIANVNGGIHVGKKRFSSRNDLRLTLVHEELHQRWYARGIPAGTHHPRDGSGLSKRFHDITDRYMKMRGWI